jgi:hypothetical protein
MAKKKPEPRLGAVKLEMDIIKRAKLIAADQGKSLAGYLSEALRVVVERDWGKMIRRTEGDGE